MRTLTCTDVAPMAIIPQETAGAYPLFPDLLSSEILQETGDEFSGCRGTIAVRCEETQSSLHRRRMGSHGCDHQVAAHFVCDSLKGFNTA